jgi:preprotein translocase subunit SecD
MQRTSNPDRFTAMAALLAAMLVLFAVTGCSSGKKDDTPRGGAETPIVAPQLVRGALPGAQVVAVATLPRTDQQAIASWLADDTPADQSPTLSPGSYKPLIDGHVLEASREVGNNDGIAVPLVVLTFDPQGMQMLADFASAHVGETVAVVLGGRVVMATKIADANTRGKLELTGPRETMDAIAKSIVPAP